MGAPIELGLRLAWHIWENKLKGKKRFPIVTMLEPLETCNLNCKGCGRIREYRESVILKNKMLSVQECLDAVEESGAPIVSIAGGEPLLHPKIHEIVAEIIKQRRFVYLCTNGLLMEQAFAKIETSKYFCWVVHLDGMAEVHDYLVGRAGAWEIAMRASCRAILEGYRVCTNTAIFKESNISDLHRLFGLLTDLGVEGIMISAGYPFKASPQQDIFLERRESIRAFRAILDPKNGFRFYHNPLYLAFLRGECDYPCRAWTNPTYTPLGWRRPCYLIADRHTQSLKPLMEESLWGCYGVGKEERCASCMMHSGFEAGIVQQAFTSPKELLKGFLRKMGLMNGRRNSS